MRIPCGTILAAALSAGIAMAAEPSLNVFVAVDPSAEAGPIRLMNSVNNGPAVPPVAGDQVLGNFRSYKAARIPMARLHDSVNCVSGGAHAVDIDKIFPDFDADENDPANYDFVFTDHYLNAIVRAGTKIYYRLGQTIEHGPKKYGVLPPKDYAKWARICEHVIRHYNEGWGWGCDNARTTRNIEYRNQFKIEYWEIWNEPDLDPFEEIAENTSPRCWGGTVEEFFKFYDVVSKHLKAKFPGLKIGGPAICGRLDWGERFLKFCRDTHAPLDFFSWHVYALEPKTIAAKCRDVRSLMDKYGFRESESILNEWNYVKGWTDDFVYSLEVESGRFNQKAAAFIAATMIDCQRAPLDHLMFYDAGVGCVMNCLFDRTTLWPRKGYYPYLCWAKLLDAGTQVEASVKEARAAKSNAATGPEPDKVYGSAVGQYRAVAAKGADGLIVVFLARYSENNETDIGTASISVSGLAPETAKVHVTDAVRTHTEIPPMFGEDGVLEVPMMPHSFAVVEFPAK